MNIECWFDGGCRPHNPGGAGAWGAIIKLPAYKDERESIFEWYGVIPQAPWVTNNIAEYNGVIAILNKLIELQYQGRVPPEATITIYGDSMLVVKQLSGEWRRNQTNKKLFEYSGLAIQGLKYFGVGRIQFKHIPREQNSRADKLVNEAFNVNGL